MSGRNQDNATNAHKCWINNSTFGEELTHNHGFLNSGKPGNCGMKKKSDISDETTSCFTLRQDGYWIVRSNVSVRIAATSVMVPNIGLWFIGGFGDIHAIETSELLNHDFISRRGPDYPMKIYEHCAVQYNDTVTVVIGGSSVGFITNETRYYSHVDNPNQEWTRLPDLNFNRTNCGCGNTPWGEVMAVGGTGSMDTVETLDFNETAK